MKFSKQDVETYLDLVEDNNSIHQYIVPGQLVCQYVLFKYHITWLNYHINYLDPITIDETIEPKFINDNTIQIINKDNKVKIHISKN